MNRGRSYPGNIFSALLCVVIGAMVQPSIYAVSSCPPPPHLRTNLQPGDRVSGFISLAAATEAPGRSGSTGSAPDLRFGEIKSGTHSNLMVEDTPGNLPEKIIVILIEFQEDETSRTSGTGKFRTEATWPDSVPHDIDYFRRMLEHLEAYWITVSSHLYLPEFQLLSDAYPGAPESIVLDRKMAHYGSGDDTDGSARLALDAVNDADPFCNFADYDAVLFIHAGCGEEADLNGDSPDDIWSTYLAECDIDKLLGTSGGLPTSDGVSIIHAAVVPETENWDGAEGDYSSIFAPLGVYAHEFAHYLGLVDLYDTTPAGYPDSWGIGYWGIMGLGAWNANGFSPPHPCAWSKARLDWVDVISVAKPGSDILLPFVEDPAEPGGKPVVIKIPLAGGEYFLIENRLQDEDENGRFTYFSSSPDDTASLDFFDPDAEDSMMDAEFDFFLPGEGDGSGLLIWHIDESIVAMFEDPCINSVNGDPLLKGVDLEEAGGIQDLDVIPGNPGSRSDSWKSDNHDAHFSDGSHPSTKANSGGRSHAAVDSIGPASVEAPFSISWQLREEGWPQKLKGEMSPGGVNISDLDGDGAEEILVSARSGEVYALGADGIPFFETSLFQVVDGGISGPPAAGNLDGEGGEDIVAASPDGHIYAWMAVEGEDGLALPLDGWPFEGTGAFLAPPVILEIDGNLNIVACSSVLGGSGYEESHVYLLAHTESAEGGEISTDWETVLEGGIWHKPALLGSEFVIAATDEGVLYALDVETGEQVWQVDGLGWIRASPLIVDIDRDGTEEAAVIEDSGLFHLFREDGTEPPGWPCMLEGFASASPGISDQDNDGYPELVVAMSEPARLIRIEHYGGSGVNQPPLTLPGSESSLDLIFSSPLSAEVESGEGDAVIVCSGDGLIYAFDPAGEDLTGFPLLGEDAIYSTPVVADLDDDDVLEIVAVYADLAAGDGDDSLTIEVWEPESIGAGRVLWSRFGGDDGLTSFFDAGLLVNPSENQEGKLFEPDSVFCAPNPAGNEGTSIYYNLLRDATQVDLHIFTFDGRNVFHMHSTDPSHISGGGFSRITWSPGNSASGIYIARLKVSDGKRADEAILKIALVRR